MVRTSLFSTVAVLCLSTICTGQELQSVLEPVEVTGQNGHPIYLNNPHEDYVVGESYPSDAHIQLVETSQDSQTWWPSWNTLKRKVMGKPEPVETEGNVDVDTLSQNHMVILPDGRTIGQSQIELVDEKTGQVTVKMIGPDGTLSDPPASAPTQLSTGSAPGPAVSTSSQSFSHGQRVSASQERQQTLAWYQRLNPFRSRIVEEARSEAWGGSNYHQVTTNQRLPRTYGSSPSLPSTYAHKPMSTYNQTTTKPSTFSGRISTSRTALKTTPQRATSYTQPSTKFAGWGAPATSSSYSVTTPRSSSWSSIPSYSHPAGAAATASQPNYGSTKYR